MFDSGDSQWRGLPDSQGNTNGASLLGENGICCISNKIHKIDLIKLKSRNSPNSRSSFSDGEIVVDSSHDLRATTINRRAKK